LGAVARIAHGTQRAVNGGSMAKKPNYRFERNERARLKAEKKKARLAAKQEKSDARKTGDTEQSTSAEQKD
jgi:hypothetical protein